jgi:succinate dehydrogenase/fumarate reductase flavoprotein subunit
MLEPCESTGSCSDEASKKCGDKKSLHSPAAEESMQTQYDVIIVGSGAAGLTAATVAAKEGLRVLVLESTPYFGGTTAFSGGGVWIPNSPQMKTAGIEDSRAEAETYLRASLGPQYDPKIVDAFLDNGPEMLRYLEANTVVRLVASPVPDYAPAAPGWKISRCLLTAEYDGEQLGAYLRLLRPPLPQFSLLGTMQIDFVDMAQLQQMLRSPSALLHVAKRIGKFLWDKLRYGRGARLINGNALVATLMRSALDAGAILHNNARVLSLILENGKVVGVEVDIHGQRDKVMATRGVILASGGFGANKTMRGRHIPMAEHGWSLQPEGCVGEGITMGIAAGGALNNTNSANGIWSPVSVMRHADGREVIFPHLFFDRHSPGSIVVDAGGRRFVSEGFHYQNFVNTMHKKGITKGFLIGDHPFQRKYGMGLAKPAPYPLGSFIDSGYLIKADSIGELARKLGIDGAALEQTVADFNRNAALGQDPEFHRGEDYYSRFMGDATHQPNPSLAPIATAPFYGLELRPGDLSTVCGLNTDANAQVVNASGQPIPGLYAAGLDMNSMMRGHYPGGGSSLGPAMTFGYVAARHIVGNA